MFKVLIILIIGPIISIGILALLKYSAAVGISTQKEMNKSAWDYLSKTKHKKWDDMTKDEQEKLVLAIQITDADCGIIRDKETIIKFLKETGISTYYEISTNESHDDKHS